MRRWIPYSAAERTWLEENRLLPISEYHARFNATFGRDLAAFNLASYRKRAGWRTGRTGRFQPGDVPVNKGKKWEDGVGSRSPAAKRTQFKKGQLPHNTKYLGHERVTRDGYVEVSVDQTNPHTGFGRRYVQKHRWLWEQKHGPVPDGYALKCIDANKANTDPSNWELVPRALLPRLNGIYGRGYDQAPAELKPIIMAAAKLEQRIHEIRPRRRPKHSGVE